MKKALSFAIIVLFLGVVSPAGAQLINEGFDDFDTGTRPAGWTFTNCNADTNTWTFYGYYGVASPSVVWKGSSGEITTETFASPSNLQFWLRGSGTQSTSSLLVEEFYSAAWNQIATINPLPNSATTQGPWGLNVATTRLSFKFTYYSGEGNCGIDDVLVTAYVATTPTPVDFKSPTPTGTPVPPTPTPTQTPVSPTTTPTPIDYKTPSPTPTAIGAPLIDEGFDDFDIGTRPVGWTFTNCNADTNTWTFYGYYGAASPSVVWKGSSGEITTETFASPSDLQFWLRGSGTQSTSSLLVEEFYSAAWNQIATINPLPNSATTQGPWGLNMATTRLSFKFTYYSGEGNCGIDDVLVTAYVATTPTPVDFKSPTPTQTPVSPTPTPTRTPVPPTPTPTRTPVSPTPTTTPTPIDYKTPSPTPTAIGAPLIDEGFDDFDTGTRPVGWAFTNCNADTNTWTFSGYYGAASPSVVWKGSSGVITTKTFASPSNLQFWLRGSGLQSTSSLLVEEFYSAAWNQIAAINPLPTSETTQGPWGLNIATTRLSFKFTYYSGEGNCGIDDVLVTASMATTPTPTRTPVPPTPPPTRTPVPPTPPPTPESSYLVLDSGDYDGDGTSDIAIFRGSNGMWSVRGVTRVYYGSSSDIPIPGDYNGDGTADIGIFRGSSGLWGVRNVTRVYYGSSSDIPIPGDYNGDGSSDIGIFRSSSGLWAVIGVTRAYYGAAGDLPVPGDYTGEGRKKIALFRGSSGMWAIEGQPRVYFGSASDKVVPGDYNGDGSWEVGIFRPASGMWAIRGVTRAYYGSSSDRPVPADFDGNSRVNIAIFRGSSGLWGIRDFSRAYFGAAGDIPVTR